MVKGGTEWGRVRALEPHFLELNPLPLTSRDFDRVTFSLCCTAIHFKLGGITAPFS